MNLASFLDARESTDAPIRVGLIGCGKFATMFAAQARRTPGLHLAAIADIAPERARANLERAGWRLDDALSNDPAGTRGTRRTWLTEDPHALLARAELDVVIEATGHPLAGARHAMAALAQGCHVVMVTVEADVLCGLAIAEEARRRGLVYTMAYGDQPALIAELVDWARTCGLPVVAAGKGTKHLPEYHFATPDTVWERYGIEPQRAAAAGMNPKMFNSFLDGTKSAIEMAAVANACRLAVPAAGLGFPPCGTDDLPRILRPRAEGGVLAEKGIVEVVSCLETDGRPVARDLRWGVYVVFEAPSDYTARCFAEYGLVTDPSGRYAALYRPYHLIGLELGVSVASAVVRHEPTGSARVWRGDVVATAKRDLAAGEMLDGEGGFTVYGRLAPAAVSREQDLLPIGLAAEVRLIRPVARNQTVRMDDVALSADDPVLELRRHHQAALA